MNEYDYLDNTIDKANEHCWNTGKYNSNCNCSLCDHQNECSGSDNDDDEEE